MRARAVLQRYCYQCCCGTRRRADRVICARSRVPQLMAGVARLSVPLLAEVGVGLNWEEAH